jgi:hypothetical protein
MSFGTVNNAVKKFKENLINKKGTLILDSKLVTKIHLTHYLVKDDIEWSGVLKYKILSGSIDDPENLILEATDFFLMDIGNAGYTEYDFNSSDEKLINYLVELQLEGLKYGHIHTHHHMNCFFSGTDMGELHDNAPNHDFYLSLIVNNKTTPDINWCAKFCYISKETKVGKISVKNNFKWSRILNGNLSVFSEDINNEEEQEINETVEVLNMIDLNLKEVKSAEYELDYNRFLEIKNKPRYQTHTSTLSSLGKAMGYKGVQSSLRDEHDWERYGLDFPLPSSKKTTNFRSRKKNVTEVEKEGNLEFNFSPQKQIGLTLSNAHELASISNIKKFLIEFFNDEFSSIGLKIDTLSELNQIDLRLPFLKRLEDSINCYLYKAIEDKFKVSINIVDEIEYYIIAFQIMKVITSEIKSEEIINLFKKEFEETLKDNPITEENLEDILKN